MKKLDFNKRINIFCGHYGSGKSEISVNAALSIKSHDEEILLADMDIVNPFFRSADAKTKLEAMGIDVIAPLYANTNVDVPVIGPEISAALKSKTRRVVLDVGGDEEGARVLGRYLSEIPQDEYEMFFVINRARPMTQNLSDTIAYIREVEFASRLKVTKLINNTHFLQQTTIKDVLYGLELVREVSEKTDIPIAATCVMNGIEDQVKDEIDHPVFILNKNILLPF
ncbi:MAG: hypothetical protein GX957_12155 [Clostridiaceae bacterium]|nr:hypothetical protein [Clostridiaceae bacterium]